MSPFTTGETDSSPRWSPDGTRLAFVREVEDRPQLAVIAVDGGEARVVTEFPLGVAGEPVWSPDGETIAIVGTVWVDEWVDVSPEERKRMPRRITRRDYRADGRGWINDRRRFLYLVDPDGGTEPRRLTDAVEDEAGPAWSPEGTKIASLSSTSPHPGYDPGAAVRVASVADGKTSEPAPWGMWSAVGYRPDGVLHAIGYPGTDFPDHPLLWRFEPEPICVNPGHARAVFSFAVGAARLAFRGDEAVVSNIDSGSVGVVAVTADGRVEELIGDRGVVSGFDVAGGTLAATFSTIESPGMLILESGAGRVVVDDFGGDQPETIRPEHFVVDGPGGPLDVWVYLPAGEGPVPLFLNIHGGRPASMAGASSTSSRCMPGRGTGW